MLTYKLVCAPASLPVGDVCSILLSNNAEQGYASPVSYISEEYPNLVQGGLASAGKGWSPDCTIHLCAVAKRRR